MNSKVIKFVAGGGKTTYSKKLLQQNKNGLYLAFTRKVVHDLKLDGYICKTIDSLFQQFLIPKLLVFLPLIVKGSRIEQVIADDSNFINLNARKIRLDLEGNICNGNKRTGISIFDTHQSLYNKTNFQNEKAIKYIFGNNILRITDTLREDISSLLLKNYSDYIVEILNRRFEFIIIDEAQDLKGYRETFAKKLFDSNINLYLLGDDNQNIMNGGTWFDSLTPDEIKNISHRCDENVCKWIRENLQISIYGKHKLFNFYNMQIGNINNYNDGHRVLLYDSNRGGIKSIVSVWKGANYNIKEAKGMTIDEDIVIAGKSLNIKNYYTAITRGTKNVYSTITKINK